MVFTVDGWSNATMRCFNGYIAIIILNKSNVIDFVNYFKIQLHNQLH
jgi:hypothetical protein